MGHLDDAVARPMIGSLLIAMLAANLLLEVRARRALRAAPAAGAAAPVMPLVTDRWWFAGTCGVAAGFITMMTNAAGAAMTVYLVAMRLPKERFIGTMAWFFLLINCVKVPLSISLGLITAPSLALDAALAGLVVLGSLAGLLVAKRIPQRAFNTVVQLLAAAAATTMFF
jgi:uncharacterized membrane protein YfcA